MRHEVGGRATAFGTPHFQKFNVAVQRGEGVGVMGPNGSGKSTLIKTRIGREKADDGEVRIGHKVQIGYHDQGLDSLAPATPVLRFPIVPVPAHPGSVSSAVVPLRCRST